MSNSSISDLSTSDLRRAVAIKEKIEALESELSAILGGSQPKGARRGRPKNASRATKVGAAKSEVDSKEPAKKPRKFSAAARAKMRKAAKARWAAAKAKGQSTL